MINIQTSYNKEAVYQGQSEISFLVQMQGVKSKNATKKDNKLNLCLAIDISTSMQEPIKRVRYERATYTQPQISPLRPQVPQPFQPQPDIWMQVNQKEVFYPQAQLSVQHYAQKIQLAKKAAIEAVAQLKDGDYISVVTFESVARTVVPLTQVNSETRKSVIEQINRIQSTGGTNLHTGWVESATQVARKLSPEFINRVLVLSDGQTLQGITDPEAICKDVSALQDKGITTTTFGIGEGFNEDLLQSMATVGGGNFYFIEDEKDFFAMFNEEFSGLSNVCAKNVKLSFQLEKGVTVKSLNSFEENAGVYSIPQVTSIGELAALFKFTTKVGKAKKQKLGSMTLSYQTQEGIEQNMTINLSLPLVPREEWQDMPDNEEIKVQETLQIIAQNQILATRAIDAGNIAGARNILTESSAFIGACGLADERLMAQNSTIAMSLAKSDDANVFRKNIAYNSYKTRNSKM